MIDPYEFAQRVREGDANVLRTIQLASQQEAQRTYQGVRDAAELGDDVLAYATEKVAERFPDEWQDRGPAVMEHLRGNIPNILAEAVYAPADPVGRTEELIVQALQSLNNVNPERGKELAQTAVGAGVRAVPPTTAAESEWSAIKNSHQDWADIRRR